MKIYHHLSDFKKLENAVVTIGTFDGVHFGHRKIVSRLVETANATGGETVILTFFPHPRLIIDPENQELKMINTINEKAAILESLGVNHLIITPFTRDFSNLSPDEYINQVLVDTIGVKHIIVGYDHRFGKDRKGCMEDLINAGKVQGFDVEEIPEQDIHDVAVSSTQIRRALLSGDVALAATYLGYHFSLKGRVIKGDKIGRTIGFPTANIFVEESYKLIPADGIYAVTVDLNEGSFKGMAYIGQRPTINGMTRNIEVNIFDFSQEIYGQDITMTFMEFLRHDVKFTGLEALKVQLQQDKEDTLAFFNKMSN
ncbi:bifunctional riboflavin kinase/FAD synthetase [Pedobacter quisquiliarum]|uniref:bifunctional riboflavin kinase/FAD synthetase n=1 Tax=Pedobacter quisquiliarum TaxID=1834438 RepID=UPI0016645901|nr:bifunctional riboflavin kinase/FAD synthetase [Pedobacter quisquiliarum]